MEDLVYAPICKSFIRKLVLSCNSYLDQRAYLVTCLDSKIPSRKKILSGIVYRYTYSNCKATYYGNRASELMGSSNLTEKRIKNAK